MTMSGRKDALQTYSSPKDIRDIRKWSNGRGTLMKSGGNTENHPMDEEEFGFRIPFGRETKSPGWATEMNTDYQNTDFRKLIEEQLASFDTIAPKTRDCGD